MSRMGGKQPVVLGVAALTLTLLAPVSAEAQIETSVSAMPDGPAITSTVAFSGRRRRRAQGWT